MKRVIDTIVDEQLDAASLADEAYKAGTTTGERLVEAARRVLVARRAGKVTALRAKELIREALILLTLDRYADIVGEVQSIVDGAMSAQGKAVAAYGKPIDTLPVIRNADIKARDLERRGATTDAGVIKKD